MNLWRACGGPQKYASADSDARRGEVKHEGSFGTTQGLRRLACNDALVELAAIILSGLSLVVAVVGTVLANKRSSEALDESRKAASSALWSGVQQAVQGFIGFDPMTEPIGDRLANFRIATIALVDELDGWAGLDVWLEAERALGAVLGRQVMEASQAADTVDERLAKLEPYQRWAQVLSQNLRRFRMVGFDADAVARLRASAESQIRAISAKHGWEVPSTHIPGLSPIEPDASGSVGAPLHNGPHGETGC